MSAAGCRKNPNFGVGSNPWGLGDPHNSQNAKKIFQKSFSQQQVSNLQSPEPESDDMPLD